MEPAHRRLINVKALANPIVGSFIGGLLYLVVTGVVLVRGYVPPPPEKPESDGIEGLPFSGEAADSAPKPPPPSWAYHNPDVEYLIIELKNQKKTLAEKEQGLKELEARLASERAELTSVTQQVARLRDDIDRDIVRIKEDESANIKRLAKMYSGMEAAGAAKIFREMDDRLVVKVMSLMKDDQTAPILEALAKADTAGAKRAAELSDRLRLVQSTTKK